MATQTLVLDAVSSSSGLTGATVANLNTQDTNWAVATSNNVATSVLCTMPTPSGPPNAGANLQTITMQVRKNSASGTGTPTARIEVWIDGGGAAILSGADTNVTSTTGQLITFTFDYSAVTGALADGSNLRVQVVGTQTGGSPSVRSSVDFGYIAWTVNYSTNITYAAAAALAGSGTINASLKLIIKAGAALNASGTETYSVNLINSIASSLNGSATINANPITIYFVGSTLNASGTTNANAQNFKDGASSLTASGTISAEAIGLLATASALNATGTLAANATLVSLPSTSKTYALLDGVFIDENSGSRQWNALGIQVNETNTAVTASKPKYYISASLNATANVTADLQAPLAFKGSLTNTASTTTDGVSGFLSVDLSSLNIQNGDFVIVGIAVPQNLDVNVPTCVSNVSGEFTNDADLYSDGVYDLNAWSFSKLATGNDTNVNFTINIPQVLPIVYTIRVYTGIDVSSELDVAVQISIGSGTDLADPPAITPITNGSIIVALYMGMQQTSTVWGIPSDISNFEQAGETGVSARPRIASGDANWTTGTINLNAIPTGQAHSWDTWGAVTYALRPSLVSSSVTSVQDASAALNASGIAGGNISGILPVTVALTGTGTNAASITEIALANAALSGSGLFGESVQAIFSPVEAFSGTGAISATISNIIPLTSALTAFATVSGDLYDIIELGSNLNASGTANASVVTTTNATSSLNASGTVAADCGIVGAVFTYDANAALNTTATINANAIEISLVTANLGASGVTQANIYNIIPVNSTNNSTGTTIVDAFRIVPIASGLNATGTISTNPVAIYGAESSLNGTATLVATCSQQGVVDIAASLVASGTSTANAKDIALATNNSTASATISATATAIVKSGAVLSGSGTLVGDIHAIIPLSSNTVGSALLDNSTTQILTMSSALANTTTLTASFLLDMMVTSSETSSGILVANASIKKLKRPYRQIQWL